MNKILIICLAFIVLCNADEYVIKTNDDVAQYRKECVKEFNVPASYIEQYKKLDFPNDETTQCYLKCFFSKFGLFDEKNGFNVENIHQQFIGKTASGLPHDDELHAKIETCIDNNSQGSSACEWAYRGATCIIKNNLALVKQNSATSPQTS